MRTASLLNRLPLLGLCLLWMYFGSPQGVGAQAGTFSITIVSPAVDQTLYAGPTSLLYSVRVTGYVETQVPEPSLVKVHLQIFRGSEMTDGGTVRLGQDGTFAFPVTVNPNGSRSDFLIAQTETGCENCHYGASVSFPAGKLLLRVTATDPAGQVASAERNITVDLSSYITLAVRVLQAGAPDRPVANVMVSATAWMYMWRARSSSGLTDAAGIAHVRVEVLNQAPTRYVFQVEPSLADGVLYESVASQDVTLLPGGPAVPQVTLVVRGQGGQIGGKVSGGTAPLPSLPIRAIHLPDGVAYSTQLSSSGTFSFTNLPIGPYRVVGDMGAAPGYSITGQDVDLSKSPTTLLDFFLAPGPANSVRGYLRDLRGNPLPFGWIAVEKLGLTQGSIPVNGAFQLSGLPTDSETLVVSAPGYFSQAQVVAASPGPGAPVEFSLTPRPETRVLPWGTGEIVLPPESQASVESQSITLNYGWLWGFGGTNAAAQLVSLPQANITLQAGKFAIEYLPDRSEWLYVIDGTASVRSTQTEARVTLGAGQMLALADAAKWVAVPIDPLVVRAIHPVDQSPVDQTWEPSLDAQFPDRLAQMGISLGQVAVFLTYSIVLLLLVFVPLLGTIRWVRRGRKIVK